MPLVGHRRPAVAILAATSLAGAIAGCGGGSSAPSGRDPASAVPAAVPFYATVVVRPGGTLKSSLDSLSQKLLNLPDPGAKIQALVQRSLSKQGLDYRRDIQPWLGSRIGVFFTSFTAAHAPDGAVVIPASDTGKARAALARDKHANGSPHSYNGVTYTVSGDTAQAIVGPFAVFGSEAGLHSVIDTVHGGASLASSATYASAIATVSSPSAIATLYAQPKTLLADAAKAAAAAPGVRNGSSVTALLQRLAGVVKSQAIVAAVTLQPKVIGIQLSSTGTTASTAGGGGADTLAALPGDAWLALGAGDIGTAITKDLNTLGSLVRTGSGRLPLRGAFNPASGLGLLRDFATWAGDAGVFVRGTGLTDLGVAVAIQSKNRAASRAAVPRIAALLKGVLGKGSTSRRLSLPGTDAGIAVTPARVPLNVDVVNAGARFVIGLGDASVSQALRPNGRFGNSTAYRTAAAALGGSVRPVFVLDFAGAATFLNVLSTSPTIGKILPVLRKLSTFAVGVGHSGSQTLVRLALALH